jgi:hypothetical protein
MDHGVTIRIDPINPRGGEQETVRNSGGTYQIVKILVVGAVTETGLQAAMPQTFYTLFAIKEDEA